MTDYTRTVDRLFDDWMRTAEANLNTEAAIVEALQRIASDLEVAYKYGDAPRADLLERKYSHIESQLPALAPEGAEHENEGDGGGLDTQPEE